MAFNNRMPRLNPGLLNNHELSMAVNRTKPRHARAVIQRPTPVCNSSSANASPMTAPSGKAERTPPFTATPLRGKNMPRSAAAGKTSIANTKVGCRTRPGPLTIAPAANRDHARICHKRQPLRDVRNSCLAASLNGGAVRGEGPHRPMGATFFKQLSPFRVALSSTPMWRIYCWLLIAAGTRYRRDEASHGSRSILTIGLLRQVAPCLEMVSNHIGVR